MAAAAVHRGARPAGSIKGAGRFVFLLFICYVIFMSSFAGTKFVIDNVHDGRAMAEPMNGTSGNAHGGLHVNTAHAEAVAEPPPIPRPESSSQYTVQAVLSPKRQAVIASGLDAKILVLNVDSGDKFKEGEILVEYDCSIDYARLKEAQSRARVTQKQVEAYERLLDMQSASTMELLMAKESNEQNKALVEQIRGRIKSCKHVAPFDGRVTRRMASPYEFVQTGRVLMDVSSLDPLRAEFLVPSKWLRWLNVGTPLAIKIGETGRSYDAQIVIIHGEVDPVSQSIQVVAEMEEYHEELLPGMSGQAEFDTQTVREGMNNGFLGLYMKPPGMESYGEKTE